MSERQIRNAQISGTSLGREDHGILSAWIRLEWEGGSQGFGGYSLDGPTSGRGDERVGTAWGMEFVARVMKTVGVERWEDLKHKHVRIDHSHTRVHRIGHIIKDEWFDPESDLAEFIKEEIKP